MLLFSVLQDGCMLNKGHMAKGLFIYAGSGGQGANKPDFVFTRHRQGQGFRFHRLIGSISYLGACYIHTYEGNKMYS